MTHSFSFILHHPYYIRIFLQNIDRQLYLGGPGQLSFYRLSLISLFCSFSAVFCYIMQNCYNSYEYKSINGIEQKRSNTYKQYIQLTKYNHKCKCQTVCDCNIFPNLIYQNKIDKMPHCKSKTKFLPAAFAWCLLITCTTLFFVYA